MNYCFFEEGVSESEDFDAEDFADVGFDSEDFAEGDFDSESLEEESLEARERNAFIASSTLSPRYD